MNALLEKFRTCGLGVFSVALLLISNACADDLWLPSIFSEGMVLQREMAVPVWGRATPGAKITATLYRGGDKLAEVSTTAAETDGRWRVDLPPQAGGGERHSLLLTAKTPDSAKEEMRLFSNVLIGDVWLICGQSNAQLPMDACAEREDAIARRHEFPLIRVAATGARNSHEVTKPQEDTRGFWGPVKWEDAAWTVTRNSSYDVPGSSSGVSYFFARALSEWMGGEIPIGMLEVTQILPVETWMDPEVASDVPELARLIGQGYPHATGRSFLANIAPLAPYALRGVIYYQGEANASRSFEYYHGLKTVIASWRRAWARPNLPFLIVQLPGYMGSGDGNHPRSPLDMPEDLLRVFDGRNVDHPYCFIREAQLRVSREVPGVGLTVIIDKGEKYDIHPPQKQPVGERLARLARTTAYGDNTVVGEGPVPSDFRLEGDRYVISFGAGAPLTGLAESPGGGLKGFELRNAEGTWHPAEAVIQDAIVIVQAQNVSQPTGVRYAWAGFPEVSLYDTTGLPATPFVSPPPDLTKQPKPAAPTTE